VEKTHKHKTNRHLQHPVENFEKKDRVKAERELQSECGYLQHVPHHHRYDQRPESLKAVSQQTDTDVLVVGKQRRNFDLKNGRSSGGLRDETASQIRQTRHDRAGRAGKQSSKHLLRESSIEKSY